MGVRAVLVWLALCYCSVFSYLHLYPPLLAYDYICYAHYRRAGFHLCLFIAYA